MMIIALMGSQVTQQSAFIERMTKDIAPDFRIKRVNLSQSLKSMPARITAINKAIAAGCAPDEALIFTGVTSMREVEILMKRKAVFGIFAGALPRLFTREGLEIGDGFHFVHINPPELETAAKRALYSNPEELFSVAWLAERKRRRMPEGVAYAAC